MTRCDVQHSERTKTIVLLGNGKAAIDFLQAIRDYRPAAPADTGARLGLVLVDVRNPDRWTTSLGDYCQQHRVPYLESPRFHSPAVRDAVRAVRPDLGVSVNNQQILRGEFLAIPPEGVINFHNSALPQYGGLNACTWALANGEQEHGVTLHRLDAGVDTGDIVAQSKFPIGEETTALQLIVRCLHEGLQLFQRTLPAILNGTASRTAQDLRQRSYYRKAEIPGGGRIDLTQPYRTVHNLVRGLNFHPLPNPLAYPLAAYRGRTFGVDRIGLVERTARHAPGTVVEARGTRLEVQVQDAVVALLQVRDERQQRIPVAALVERYGIEVGTHVQ